MINELMQCASNLITIGDWEAAAYAYAALSFYLKRN